MRCDNFGLLFESLMQWKICFSIVAFIKTCNPSIARIKRKVITGLFPSFRNAKSFGRRHIDKNQNMVGLPLIERQHFVDN